MNKILLALLTGALLGLIAYTFLRNPCPPANRIISPDFPELQAGHPLTL